MADTWSPAGPSRYQLSPSAPLTTTPSELHSITTASHAETSAARPFSLENPLLAFGAIAGLTFGLAAFSTSVRVGNSRASLDLGKA